MVLAVDRKNGSLVFPCQWGGAPSYKMIRGCRFYLEDKPQYLDSPGEFWFDKKGDGGRLYIRLHGDQDPNTARIEVAKRIHMTDSSAMSHVHISGLTFRFTNIYWNLTAAPYWVSHESIDVEPSCVRLLGSGTDIEVTHCIFDRVCAQGIDVYDAKPSGAATDRPFTRIFIQHNKVVDSLLNVGVFGRPRSWLTKRPPARPTRTRELRRSPSRPCSARQMEAGQRPGRQEGHED